jgi:hypothetical protein
MHHASDPGVNRVEYWLRNPRDGCQVGDEVLRAYVLLARQMA